jgi:hypothetical protein
VKVDRKDIIGGQPAKVARDLVLWIGHGWTTPRLVAGRFTLDAGATKALLAAMVKRRLLVRHPPNDYSRGEHIYRIGDEAHRFGNAKFIKRLDRAKAGVVLADLLRRVAEINADPELCCYVRELRLFGSMLDPKAKTVGDIDVAYDLGRRKVPPQYGGDHPYVDWNIARAEAAGRGYLDYHGLITYGHTEVKRLLKARNRYLSLHTMADLDGIGAKHKRIFRADPATVANIDPDDKTAPRRAASRKATRKAAPTRKVFRKVGQSRKSEGAVSC